MRGICFSVKDDRIKLKQDDDICRKVIDITKLGLDSKLRYNKELLKTKIKSDGDKAANFHDNEIP